MIVANDPTVKGYILFYSEEHITQLLLRSISEPKKSPWKTNFHASILLILEEPTCPDKVKSSLQKDISEESFTTWLKCQPREFLRCP